MPVTSQTAIIWGMNSFKILVATSNKHKLEEIREIFEMPFVELVGLDVFPNLPELVEDGVTFDENARKKAVVLAEFSGMWTLADDSGLEVTSLDGRPGVYSARYAGELVNYTANNAKLLKELVGKKDRSARFRCVVALAMPDGGCITVEGICEGNIAKEESGMNGFGYDPLFIPKGYTQTFAEMSPKQKNDLSHRGTALRKAAKEWGSLLQTKTAIPKAALTDKFSKAAILNSEIEAVVLSARLDEKEIPHILRSYHDSAYDGIFQQGRGWGCVEAPVEFHPAVMDVLENIVRSGMDADNTDSEEENE